MEWGSFLLHTGENISKKKETMKKTIKGPFSKRVHFLVKLTSLNSMVNFRGPKVWFAY